MHTSVCRSWLTLILGFGALHAIGASGRGSEPTTLRGHQKPVADVEFSADGSLLASMSTDGETIIWDLTSGSARRAPGLPRNLSVAEQYLKFTVETAPMLMAGCNSHGFVMDPQTLQSVSEWGDRTRLNASALDYAGGRRVIIPPAVYEAGKAEVLFTVVDRGPILSAISPDGKRWFTNYLIPHGNNAQVQVLDAATGKVQCDLKAFSSAVEGIAWVDQNRVLTLVDGGDYGGSLMLWDVSGRGKLLAKMDVPGAWRMTVSANGQSAALALSDQSEQKVALIAVGDKQLTIARTVKAKLYSNDEPTFSMSRDGAQMLAASMADSRWQLVVFDTKSGAELLVHTRQQDDTLPELSPDGRWVAVGHADGTISLFPVGSADAPAGGGPLTQILDLPLEHPQAPGMPEGIRNLFRHFDDGKVEVSMAGDMFVVHVANLASVASAKVGAKHWPVWEASSNRKPFAAKLPTWALLPDGTFWVEGKVVDTDKIHKYFCGSVDPATGQYQLQTQSRNGEEYTAMRPSPDGKLMAVRSGNWTFERLFRKPLPPKLLLLDLKTGELVRTLATDLDADANCRGIIFSSSGKRLAVHEGRKLRVFDTETGDEVPLAGEWNPYRYWLVDDGKILARQESDGSIVGVDLETQGETFRWMPSNGQTGYVTAVELSLDGKLAAVGGQNGDLTLRDSRTGAVLHRLKPFELAIGGLGFSADGTVLAAADEQRRLIAWKLGSFEAQPVGNGAATPREIRVQNAPEK